MKKDIRTWILTVCIIYLAIPTYATNSTEAQRYMRSTNDSKNFAANLSVLSEDTTKTSDRAEIQFNSTGMTTSDKVICFVILGVIITLSCLLLWKLCRMDNSVSVILPPSLYSSGIYNKDNALSLRGSAQVKDLLTINLLKEVENRREVDFSSFNSSEWSESPIKLTNESKKKIDNA